MANSEAEGDRWDFWAGGEESRYVDSPETEEVRDMVQNRVTKPCSRM